MPEYKKRNERRAYSLPRKKNGEGRNRREYHQKYYAANKARIAGQKAQRQKMDLDYRLRILLRTIIQRCEDPRHISYRWYGGKGIRNFLTLDDLKALWVRDGASQMVKPSIDRASSDDDYEFSKCRFRELRDNQERAWFDKEARGAAISAGMKARLGVPARGEKAA